MKPGKLDLFKFILKETGIKCVGYYGNAKMKLKTYQSTIQPLSCKKMLLMMVSLTVGEQ